MFGRKKQPLHRAQPDDMNGVELSQAKVTHHSQDRFSAIQHEVMAAIEPAVVVQLSRQELETRTYEPLAR